VETKREVIFPKVPNYFLRNLTGEYPAIPDLQGGIKSIRPDHGRCNAKETPCGKALPFSPEIAEELISVRTP
jgi:hypothetical protein